VLPRVSSSPADQNTDVVSRALRAPHRLLEPIDRPAGPGQAGA
jgi:hypothetical protein